MGKPIVKVERSAASVSEQGALLFRLSTNAMVNMSIMHTTVHRAPKTPPVTPMSFAQSGINMCPEGPWDCTSSGTF